MAEKRPFVLLDDARECGAADALLFENPREIFIAQRPEQVAEALAAAEAARQAGGELAGFIAYEAGLALEDRLRPLADARSGGGGPLVVPLPLGIESIKVNTVNSMAVYRTVIGALSVNTVNSMAVYRTVVGALSVNTVNSIAVYRIS